MERDHHRGNDESRRRLAVLVTRLGEGDLRRDLGAGWTAAAALAHIAFRDRSCLAHWERVGDEGAIAEFPDAPIDIINEANLPFWRALPPADVVEPALAAAKEVDARVAALGSTAVAYARETGRDFLVDRAGHRHAHLDEIERALGVE